MILISLDHFILYSLYSCYLFFLRSNKNVTVRLKHEIEIYSLIYLFIIYLFIEKNFDATLAICQFEKKINK